MHFDTKNYLKNNRFHTIKYILIPTTLTIISLHETHESPNLLVKIYSRDPSHKIVCCKVISSRQN